jgi:Predicted membrane protein
MNEHLQPWLARYAQSHRNPVNKHLHQLCVPLILFAAIGLLRAAALPGAGFNLALPAIVLALVYYLWLSPTRAIGMAILLIAFYLLADASLRRFGTGCTSP